MIKGAKISLFSATMADRERIYHWCFQSETTRFHSGPPDFPEIPIPTFKKFCEDYYEEYFFTGTKPEAGQGFLIVKDEKAVGFISYSCFHLKSGLAELDIWLDSEGNCGKGFGVDALVSLGTYLKERLAIHTLIIAPAIKNTRAVRSYEKAGFKKTSTAMTEFLQKEYFSLYGAGDYGTEDTIILVKLFE